MKNALIIFSSLAAAIVTITVAAVIADAPLETYSNGDKISIINHGTGSMGSYARYALSNYEVIEENRKLEKYYSLFWNRYNDFGWEFKAVRSGSVFVYVDDFDCGDIAYSDIYNITIDANLNISYEVHRTERLPAVWKFADDNRGITSVVCEYNGKSAEFTDAALTDELREIVKRLYGSSKPLPDRETPEHIGKVRVDFDMQNQYNTSKNDMEIYIGQDCIYYTYNYYADGTDLWNKFVPDEWCSLDELNGFLVTQCSRAEH